MKPVPHARIVEGDVAPPAGAWIETSEQRQAAVDAFDFHGFRAVGLETGMSTCWRLQEAKPPTH